MPLKLKPGEEEKPEIKVKKPVIKPKPKPKPEVPSVTESLPFAFRKGRKLYPKEIEYAREIFGDSINYDKVRLTRDHHFTRGAGARVLGNTINFASQHGSDFLFEDTPEWALNNAGLDLLGHEIGHVWQYQNGGIAYAGDSVAKQAAGAYATGSRNTAYDWKEADYWEVPWEKWGPEQQAQAIDDWNMALRHNPKKKREIIEKLQPYVDKARKGLGPTKFSIPGALVVSLIFAGIGCGIGYLRTKDIKGIKCGARAGAILGLLVNLPWNKWFLKKPDRGPIVYLEDKVFPPEPEESESELDIEV